MKRRALLSAAAALPSLAVLGVLCQVAQPAVQRAAPGDLGVIIGRANGTLYLVDTTVAQTLIGEVPGLGDLSHASVVFLRDGLFAYVRPRWRPHAGQLLEQRITRRVMQAGNSIGGAIADGSLVVA